MFFLPSFYSVYPFPSLFLSWHLSALGISITWPPCFQRFLLYHSITLLSLSLPSPLFLSKLAPPHNSSFSYILRFFHTTLCHLPLSFILLFMLPWIGSLEMFCLRSFIPCFISIGSGHFSYFCSLMHPVSLCLDDYKSELREQLPLIAGSAAAGVVFIVSLVAISIVCSRWVCHYGARHMTAACVRKDRKPQACSD